MSRTCQADDALERHFEALLKQQSAPEIGLLVGKHTAGAKAFLYGTIRTPSQEGVNPFVMVGVSPSGGAFGSGKISKKTHCAGGRGASAAVSGGVAVTLEAEWITEHARQVARMLPGGIFVLGLYIFCPDPAHTVALPHLCTLLAGLAAFCLPTSSAGASDFSSDSYPHPQHLLLLHIDASSRKQALRALPLLSSSAATSASAVPSALRPVELKFAPMLGSLMMLRCRHGVDLQMPVAAGSQHMRQNLTAVVEAESERIRHSVFVTAGAAVLGPESATVGEALSATGSGLQHAPGVNDLSGRCLLIPTMDLTLLVPPPCQLPVAEIGPGRSTPQQGEKSLAVGAGIQAVEVVGQARLHGCMQGLAIVGKRDSVGRALAELKADLLSSLSARLELLVEETTRMAEQQQDACQQGPNRTASLAACGQAEPPSHPLLCSPTQLAGAGAGGCDVALPRRVLLPWLDGALALCDYLLEGEPVEAAVERGVELLALQGNCQVVECELPAPGSAASERWQPNMLPGKEVSSTGLVAVSSSSKLSCSGTVLTSLIVAAVASAVGLLSLWGQAAPPVRGSL